MNSSQVQIPGYVAGSWDLDPVHTEVGFSVRHMMVSKVRGRFTDIQGVLVTAEDPLDSSVTATIGMASIATGNSTRDDDLRSTNYFQADQYPQMTYRSTGLHADGDAFTLNGDLTAHGVTRPVPLHLEINGFGPDPYGGQRCGFSATGSINRSDFGMNFTTPLDSGGVVVGDRIDITIEAEAVLRPPAST